MPWYLASIDTSWNSWFSWQWPLQYFLLFLWTFLISSLCVWLTCLHPFLQYWIYSRVTLKSFSYSRHFSWIISSFFSMCLSWLFPSNEIILIIINTYWEFFLFHVHSSEFYGINSLSPHNNPKVLLSFISFISEKSKT